MFQPLTLLLFASFCLLQLDRPVEANSQAAATQLLANLIPSNYSTQIRPNYGASPVNVSISLHITELTDISEKTNDFRVQMYFRHGWSDSRLSFTPQDGLQTLYLGEAFARRIWIPDTFFANGKSVQFQKLAMTGKDAEFISLNANGDLFMSRMIEVVASCPMNVQNYPFDRQLCTLEMESYGYSMSDVIYSWRSGKAAIGMSAYSPGPDFTICGFKQLAKVESLSSGNYSRLVVELDMVRNSHPFYLRVYLPTFTLVLLSWIPLWLSQSSDYFRVAIALGLFLTSLAWNAFNCVEIGSTTRLLDYFLIHSSLAILAVLLYLTVVAFLGRKPNFSYAKVPEVNGTKERTGCLDKAVRWAFPGLYLLYVLVHICALKWALSFTGVRP